MKMIPVLLTLISLNASASTLTCKTTGGMLVIQTNRNEVATIDFYQPIRERIFSNWPMIRGGLDVDQCSPDVNRYSPNSSRYYISSLCWSRSRPVGRIQFDADFTKAGGVIEYIDEAGYFRSLEFGECQ